MSFMQKLKQALETIPLEDNLTSDEYREHFKIFVESNLKSRLALMDKWCAVMNDKFPIVAAQDVFSKRFEAEITDQIDLWVRQDDALRARYKRICDKFKTKLDIQVMQNVVNEVLRKFHSDIENHIADANKYGKDWATRLDNAGLTILNPTIKHTITWFSTLTLQEIARDYRREVNLD